MDGVGSSAPKELTESPSPSDSSRHDDVLNIVVSVMGSLSAVAVLPPPEEEWHDEADWNSSEISE